MWLNCLRSSASITSVCTENVAYNDNDIAFTFSAIILYYPWSSMPSGYNHFCIMVTMHFTKCTHPNRRHHCVYSSACWCLFAWDEESSTVLEATAEEEPPKTVSSPALPYWRLILTLYWGKDGPGRTWSASLSTLSTIAGEQTRTGPGLNIKPIKQTWLRWGWLRGVSSNHLLWGFRRSLCS